MKAEEIVETIIIIGKVAGSIAAVVKCLQYVIDLCRDLRNYFEEKPEVQLERLRDELKVLRENHQECLKERKKGFSFFQKISDEEKKKRDEEDKIYEETKLDLKDRIFKLEKELGYEQNNTCVLM